MQIDRIRYGKNGLLFFKEVSSYIKAGELGTSELDPRAEKLEGEDGFWIKVAIADKFALDAVEITREEYEAAQPQDVEDAYENSRAFIQNAFLEYITPIKNEYEAKREALRLKLGLTEEEMRLL